MNINQSIFFSMYMNNNKPPNSYACYFCIVFRYKTYRKLQINVKFSSATPIFINAKARLVATLALRKYGLYGATVAKRCIRQSYALGMELKYRLCLYFALFSIWGAAGTCKLIS